MDSWKYHQMSEPRRRGYVSPHREKSGVYPNWISRIPRIPPDARRDDSDRFMHSAERRPPPSFEPDSYQRESRQRGYDQRSRSPHFRERLPYLR